LSFHRLYYRIKPAIPRPVQLCLRRQLVRLQRSRCGGRWPIDPGSSRPPDGWSGWPEGKRFALVLTHDVESSQGVEKCRELANVEERLGFRSSFNFVAEKYPIPVELRKDLAGRGFEIGIHGLYHDGKYFDSKEEFGRRAARINRYLEEWDVVGFRTPSMLHNLEWLHALEIRYDSSTFDTDPFEPQSDGIGTIFPFYLPSPGNGRGYVEMPYTLPQDFTLYVLMKEKSIGIWKRKLDWIARQGGMALLITHPDYLRMDGTDRGSERYPIDYYVEFLRYVSGRYGNEYWHALPADVARHVAEREDGWKSRKP
jgi:peptidoglycan/xylan/chitin deacetylase (PgdA/CDA1 family)